jgi:hypothetical protein
MDYDAEENSLVAYRVRFEKELYVEPIMNVTLDNCTGIAKKDQVIPKNNVQITIGSKTILLPLKSNRSSCANERCSFADIYNDAEFSTVLNVTDADFYSDKDPVKIIFKYLKKAIKVWKKKVLDRVQIQKITACEFYKSSRGRLTTKPFDFVYQQALILDEDVYFFTPLADLTKKNMINKVFCNVQTTIKTNLDNCMDIMLELTSALLDIKELINPSEVSSLIILPRANQEILENAKKGQYSELEIKMAGLINYAWASRNHRKSHPFIIRHLSYHLLHAMPTLERMRTISLLPSRIHPSIEKSLSQKSYAYQRMEDCTVFTLEYDGLDTKILFEFRYLQYLISSKLGNTTNVMTNSVKSLLEL